MQVGTAVSRHLTSIKIASQQRKYQMLTKWRKKKNRTLWTTVESINGTVVVGQYGDWKIKIKWPILGLHSTERGTQRDIYMGTVTHNSYFVEVGLAYSRARALAAIGEAWSSSPSPGGKWKPPRCYWQTDNQKVVWLSLYILTDTTCVTLGDSILNENQSQKGKWCWPQFYKVEKSNIKAGGGVEVPGLWTERAGV